MAGELGSILVAGAGLAGVSTCQQLRHFGYPGRIVLLGDENRAPYDRPPLTKAVLAGKRDDTTLRTDLIGLDVDVRPGTTATNLRVSDRVVETTAGEIPFDGLVIATGARPVTLGGDGVQHTVRTLGDALRLRAALVPGARVALIGAGWIGAEVATAALALGCQVTCIEAAPTVLYTALGELGCRFEPWWGDVSLRLGVSVESIEPGAVRLVGGEIVEADVVVTGVGARANVEWLRSSGLSLDRGVVVDSQLRAAENIVAVGDVASWWSERYARRLRVEHWDHAAMSAVAAAASLLAVPGGPSRYDPVPYFWSDQFGHKIQCLGVHGPDSELVVRTRLETHEWGAGWFDGEGRLVAMLCVDQPRELVAARELLTVGARVDPVRFADGKIPLRETALTSDKTPVRSHDAARTP